MGGGAVLEPRPGPLTEDLGRGTLCPGQASLMHSHRWPFEKCQCPRSRPLSLSTVSAPAPGRSQGQLLPRALGGTQHSDTAVVASRAAGFLPTEPCAGLCCRM